MSGLKHSPVIPPLRLTHTLVDRLPQRVDERGPVMLEYPPPEFYHRTAAGMLAGLVGGLLVTITGVNLGMGGATSIKAFMMVMIGGAGVISGAIWGGIILGFMEAIGLALLYQYGDITYLLIFVSLMIFLAIRPQGLMGKPWG